MNLLHEAYTALLSGITTKTGNEIHWINKNGNPITIEPIDISQEKYILRRYYDNGQKYYETEYQNGQMHGRSLGWYENGQKHWETEYQNGQRHGKYIMRYENGQKVWEEEWKNGQLHYKSIGWWKKLAKILGRRIFKCTATW